uniref:Large ribosomal subunit protein uL18m n=1 Tax=Strigamia maritima TaxID=126957 RepID=T1IXE3_STRMM
MMVTSRWLFALSVLLMQIEFSFQFTINNVILTVQPYEEECFFERMSVDDSFILNLIVTEGGFLDINFKEIYPNKTINIESKIKEKFFQYIGTEEGIFTFCLNNEFSSVSPKVMRLVYVLIGAEQRRELKEANNSGNETTEFMLSELADNLKQFESANAVLAARKILHHQRPRYCTDGFSALDKPLSENDSIKSQVINRNPRNLQQLRLERKPRGWHLERPTRKYWNKLFFSATSRRVSAKVQHNNGQIIVQASSVEPCIIQYLESVSDKRAAETVAMVLADRCLMAGILHVHISYTETELRKEKLKLFLDTFQKSGVSLKEPPQYFHTTIFSGR